MDLSHSLVSIAAVARRGHIKRAEIKSREMLDCDLDAEQSPNHAHSPSLSDSYLPTHLGCTQQSLSCSVIIEGRSSHSHQSSASSNFDHFLGTQGDISEEAETTSCILSADGHGAVLFSHVRSDGDC
jgi:hypothetical protein